MTGGGEFAPCRMANVLKHEEQEQIRALGRLGWSLRRIEEATGVRRETIARYLRWSGIRLRRPRGRKLGPKAASEVANRPRGIAWGRFKTGQ